MESEEQQVCLEHFHISRNTGFLIEQPLRELPADYAVWHQMASVAEERVKAKCFRQEVDQMAVLDHGSLKTYREKRLAHLQLTLIASCYIWQEGDVGVPQALPACVSVPWWEISEELGLQPSVNHADLVLANWRLADTNRPWSLDNLEVLYPWPGGESAKWFILITVQMEKDFVDGLLHIESGLRSVSTREENTLIKSLQGVQQVISRLKSTFSQMHDRVHPEGFYDELRPFLSGWGGDGSPLPQGLIYAGASDYPKTVTGGSAAQSSIFQTIDAFLGVEHTDSEKDFLLNMRSYMPLDHRTFIERIETHRPSLRQYVKASDNTSLKTAFEDCLNTLVAFRSYHLTIVTKYIVVMSHRKGYNQVYDSVSKQGTGGSSVLPFLKAIRSTTESARI